MTLEFIPVVSEEDIEQVARMADEIWHEYWPGLISYAQVDYMIETFQSKEALSADIKEADYKYWIVKDSGRAIGYTGSHIEMDNSKLFISKIYLYSAERGRGLAAKIIAFYQDICKQNGLSAMYLTVNKYNTLGIRAYERNGFVKIRSAVTNIGKGFVMDDYIMEKIVE